MTILSDRQINRLAEKHAVMPVLTSRSIRFPIADALAMVNACRMEGILILGIEGFVEWDGVTCPDMNAIADYSDVLQNDSLQGKHQVYDMSLSFLNERSAINPGLIFEFALCADDHQ